jgi:hypothetical protein
VVGLAQAELDQSEYTDPSAEQMEQGRKAELRIRAEIDSKASGDRLTQGVGTQMRRLQ